MSFPPIQHKVQVAVAPNEPCFLRAFGGRSQPAGFGRDEICTEILPPKKTCPLKIDGWKMTFSFGMVPFIGDMSKIFFVSHGFSWFSWRGAYNLVLHYRLLLESFSRRKCSLSPALKAGGLCIAHINSNLLGGSSRKWLITMVIVFVP